MSSPDFGHTIGDARKKAAESHPSPPSDLEGRIAEVLAGHGRIRCATRVDPNRCTCGDEVGWTLDDYDAHLAAQLAEVVKQAQAEAWDEGHQHRWKRDANDGCRCGAWSSNECGCGKYGTGELLSLSDNPYDTSEAQR